MSATATKLPQFIIIIISSVRSFLLFACSSRFRPSKAIWISDCSTALAWFSQCVCGTTWPPNSNNCSLPRVIQQFTARPHGHYRILICLFKMETQKQIHIFYICKVHICDRVTMSNVQNRENQPTETSCTHIYSYAMPRFGADEMLGTALHAPNVRSPIINSSHKWVVSRSAIIMSKQTDGEKDEEKGRNKLRERKSFGQTKKSEMNQTHNKK